MVNVDIAKKIYDQITAYPDTFNMSSWAITRPYMEFVSPAQIHDVCGTTACLAGHAAILAGRAKLVHHRDHVDGKILSSQWLPDSDWVIDGCEALGISVDLGSVLFYKDDDTALDAIRILAEGGSEKDVWYAIGYYESYDYDCEDCYPNGLDEDDEED